MPDNDRNFLCRAIESDDVSAVEAGVFAHPELLNAVGTRPPVTFARSVVMAERLLSLGADVEAAGKWWASGMGTRKVEPSVAKFLAKRGANLTAHAAAGFGLADRLEEMLDADPSLIDAKGGDGCTPLHFSRDIATAQLL